MWCPFGGPQQSGRSGEEQLIFGLLEGPEKLFSQSAVSDRGLREEKTLRRGQDSFGEFCVCAFVCGLKCTGLRWENIHTAQSEFQLIW